MGAVAGRLGSSAGHLRFKTSAIADVHIDDKLSWKVRPRQLVSVTLSGGLRWGAVIIRLNISAGHEAPVAI